MNASNQLNLAAAASSQAFWTAVISAILLVLSNGLGWIKPDDVPTLEAAGAIIIAVIFGLMGKAVAHVSAATTLQKTIMETPVVSSPATPPTP